MRRILANQETRPANGGEWQRASVSPRSTLGKTFLDSNDESQLLNYVLWTHPLTLVGGPSQPSSLSEYANLDDSKTIFSESGEKTEKETSPQVMLLPATVSAATVNVSNGAATVPVSLNTDGTAVAVQFTINYDSSKLTLASVTNPNSTFTNVIANGSTPGEIKVVAYRYSMTIPFPLNSQILGLNFTVNQNSFGTVPINFSDTPVTRLASDAVANGITLNSSSGSVIISGPTGASVTVAGRVVSASGRRINRARVLVTMPNGETETVTTNTFGYFRFNEIPVGGTYIFSVEHTRYVFNPQVLNLTDSVGNLDFTALSEP